MYLSLVRNSSSSLCRASEECETPTPGTFIQGSPAALSACCVPTQSALGLTYGALAQKILNEFCHEAMLGWRSVLANPKHKSRMG